MTATRPHSATRPNSNAAIGFLTSGWLWGLTLTVGFYASLPYFPIMRDDAQRYFCAHWIEYATTGLFFVGMATLFLKSLRIPAEGRALQSDVLDGLAPQPGQAATATADQIEHHLRLVARHSADSIVVRRIREVCDYIRARCSADGIESHLNYLAELNAGRLHESYALIRTITWAVPILGFLGTVIGITMAIANVTPDQLSSSLNDVTAGLAVAFDTTALSLALSMILVFATFVVERTEQRQLDGVEDFLVQRLTALFPTTPSQTHSLMDAESQTAQRWIRETELLIHVQQEEWRQTLDGLRQRWNDTLERQQQQLVENLQTAAMQTLADHSQHLGNIRSEIGTTMLEGANALAARWEEVQRNWQAEQAAIREDIVAIWTGFREELQASAKGQATAISGWQGDLQDATAAAAEHLAELRRQGDTLERLAGQEAELLRLEERLSHNLETVRVAQSLEETVLNLNAAVHILTARTLPRAA